MFFFFDTGSGAFNMHVVVVKVIKKNTVCKLDAKNVDLSKCHSSTEANYIF